MRSEYDADNRTAVIPSELRGTAFENIVNRLTEIRSQQRKHDFGFRISETGIEFDDLRPLSGCDKTGIQDAGERGSLLSHGLDGGTDDRVDCGVDDIRADLWHRTIGSHASGVRTFVAIVGTFMILRNRHRPELRAVHEAHQ